MAINSKDFDLNQFPEWWQAHETLHRLNTKRDAIEADIQASFNIKAESAREKRLTIAKDLITRASIGDGIEMVDRAEKEWIGDIQARLYCSKHSIEEAIKLQRKDIGQLRYVLSRRIIEKVRPRYVGIIQKLVNCMVELEAAAQEENEFGEAMTDNDVAWLTMQREGFTTLGFLKDRYSSISLFLREVEENYPELKGPVGLIRRRAA